jgi:hypothetical protein
MGPKRRIALVGVVVGAMGVVAPSADACKRIAPGVCEESGNVTMPPNSYGSQTTDTVPSQSNTESTYLEPFNTQELADFDSLWDSVADGYPKFAGIQNTTVRRVITCALVARWVGDIYGAISKGTLQRRTVAADNGNAAVLAMCVQAAVIGQQASGQARDAASAKGCSTAVVSIPVLISRSGSRYTIQANSRVNKAAGRGPLAVSCQATRTGMFVKLRTRKRGQKLRSVVGPKFGIGYSNPTSKSVRFRATFRFG